MLLTERYKTLSSNQANKLKNLLVHFGNGVAIANATGLHINTIKRASDGLRVSEETAEILDTYLKTIKN